MKNLNLLAYAKINLYLDIVGRRADGYHELRTVMQSVGLFDMLDLSLDEGEGIEITCANRSDLPCDKSNLVYKGIDEFLRYTKIKPDCKIKAVLTKYIPSGAGMGGGSADCAAVIRGMNTLFKTNLSADEMRSIGAVCGADVPFCIEGGTALCEGIGEKITPLKPLENVWIAIAKPDEGISTPLAYKKFDEKGKLDFVDYETFSAALDSGDIGKLGSALYNAFTPVCELNAVHGVIACMKANGALGAEMTGSGSAVFGLFDSRESAQKAAERCGCGFCGAYVTVPNGVGNYVVLDED